MITKIVCECGYSNDLEISKVIDRQRQFKCLGCKETFEVNINTSVSAPKQVSHYGCLTTCGEVHNFELYAETRNRARIACRFCGHVRLIVDNSNWNFTSYHGIKGD